MRWSLLFLCACGATSTPEPAVAEPLQAIRHLEQLVDAWEESCVERDLDALHAATEGLVPRYGIAYSAHAFELSLILDIAEVDSPCAADGRTGISSGAVETRGSLGVNLRLGSRSSAMRHRC